MDGPLGMSKLRRPNKETLAKYKLSYIELRRDDDSCMQQITTEKLT